MSAVPRGDAAAACVRCPPRLGRGFPRRGRQGAAWAFLAELGVAYPNLADPEAKMLTGLHVPGVPVTFVLDSSGTIVFRHIGELHESDIAEMETAAKTAR